MSYQNIDASLSPAEVKAIKDAFGIVLKKLPFLVNMTPHERKIVFKTGPDSVSFVQNALDAAQDHPSILPGSFSTKGFEKDVDLFTTLTELGTLAESVASQIDDTRLAVGSEAMREATEVYNYVKAAAKTTPGLKPIAEQLGERFKGASKKKQPDHPEA
ncbi:hypothetical protein [Candidatus Thiosymbion oneisti]|uniref:hypothetical protein n=1 Tax=Candidatus Thiosymbion oneisti TaxID=589554 RepID=UPI00105BB745|nr:hypothetical protein [Candidatus Thiosymbion oneisti]